MAQKLSKQNQVVHNSLPQIVEGLKASTSALGVRRRKFEGRAIRVGHLVNAVLLWLVRLNPQDLDEFTRDKLADLEKYLAKSNPDDILDAISTGSILSGEPRGLTAENAGSKAVKQAALAKRNQIIDGAGKRLKK